MNYEIVELKEKTIVGFAARTGNEDPQMGAIIGDLWKKLYTPENTEKIHSRVNTYAIGLYSDYDDAGYQVTAGFEVSDAGNADGLAVKTIPAGKYAKFSVHGDMVEAVANSWKEIWETPLERTYTGDFEEYLSNEDIDIYIAIK
ncbi:MAG: GyrI-like domain-containing protein [bacterium]|nr:GyrI-like domain-containing protein [bacterium]